jgi:hypothetical protein
VSQLRGNKREIGVHKTYLNLLAAVSIACLLVPAHAQQNIPGAPTVRLQNSPSLPNSVDKLKAAKTPVLVIPEASIVEGLGLTEVQKATLTQNLRAAPFKTLAPQALSAKDLAAQKLPGGELLQLLPRERFATIPSSSTIPVDPCAIADHTDDQLSALQKVLAAQLAQSGGDVNDFVSNVPKNCKRKQLIYFMRSAALIAR